jgi:cysteinyl-tRNA synthetase
MYTCGPTVYDYAHVGNFRAFLTYDLIKRALMYFGYDVTHICNLTDVDDKIINRANEQKIERITDLTRMYEDFFFQDLKALNVVPADRYPRATEHIDEMMDMILALGEKDLAYEAEDGSWYFATANKVGYGQQLVQLNIDEMEMTERGESDMKRDAQDFALWKAFKPGVDREDSSWERPGKIQKGRPGWHLECSAMARKYLGDTIDIHGGGVDLKFPHHENEIAQSEGVTGKIFCNCWVHNGFVNINDEKMSKSLGNFLTLRVACPQSQDIRAYRFLVMSAQYGKPLSFTPKAMEAAKSSLKRIDKVMEQIEGVVMDHDGTDENGTSPIYESVAAKALADFENALLDDLSMPRAAASLFSLIKAAESEFKRVLKDGTETKHDVVGLKHIVDAMRQMDRVFGIFYEVPLTQQEKDAAEANAANGSANGSDGNIVPDEVMQLVIRRTEAKESKDWELADSLRARVTELGFAIKDVKGGDSVVSRVE